MTSSYVQPYPDDPVPNRKSSSHGIPHNLFLDPAPLDQIFNHDACLAELDTCRQPECIYGSIGVDIWVGICSKNTADFFCADFLWKFHRGSAPCDHALRSSRPVDLDIWQNSLSHWSECRKNHGKYAVKSTMNPHQLVRNFSCAFTAKMLQILCGFCAEKLQQIHHVLSYPYNLFILLQLILLS